MIFMGKKVQTISTSCTYRWSSGTTAQTSDINITSRETRRTVMLHGLLSFFFNTMVIALVVNLTAQFAG